MPQDSDPLGATEQIHAAGDGRPNAGTRSAPRTDDATTTRIVRNRRLLPLADDDPEALGKYVLRRRIPGGQDASRKYLAQLLADPDGEEFFVKWIPAMPLPSERYLNPDELTDLRKRRAALARLLSTATSRMQDIESPFLPKVVEFVADPLGPYVVEEFVTGQPLDEYLVGFAGNVLPAGEAVAVALEMLQCLVPLHDRDLIHCDVKTSNFMLRSNGEIVLTDFDTLQRMRETPRELLGSHYYLAPERFKGATQTEKVDIYGWGMTVAETAAGLRPYDSQGKYARDSDGYLDRLVATSPAPYTASIQSPQIRAAVNASIDLRPEIRRSIRDLEGILTGAGTGTQVLRPPAPPVKRMTGPVTEAAERAAARYKAGLRTLASDNVLYYGLYGVAFVGAIFAAFALRVVWYALVAAG